MVKTLGVVFIAILIALPVAFMDQRYSNGFLYDFFRGQALGIVATVLALNVVTITFLVGHLVSLENKANKPLFTKTKNEIKQNVYLMTGLLLTSLALVSSSNPRELVTIGNVKYNVIIFFALVTFILVFITLLEVVKAIFKATQFIQSNRP